MKKNINLIVSFLLFGLIFVSFTGCNKKDDLDKLN